MSCLEIQASDSDFAIIRIALRLRAINRSLHISLLLLRLGVFVVIFIWTIDKSVNPEHASGIFEKFYGLDGFGVRPMWAACIALFLMRRHDRYTLGGARHPA